MRNIKLEGFYTIRQFENRTELEIAEIYKHLSDLFESGNLSTEIAQVYSLDMVKDAVEHAGRRGSDRNGKITARNIQTYRALGSELSRVVEQLNALNRASAKRSIGYEKGRRLQERIDAIDPAKGAKAFTKPSQIATARKTAASVIAAADTGDQNLYNQILVLHLQDFLISLLLS